MWFLLAAAVAFVWFFLRRANELCAILVTSGVSRLVRGRAPARFLSDVSDIVQRAAVPHALLRVVVESGAPRLIAPPAVPEDVAQQLRNATGQHRVLHFRAGRRAS